MLRDAFAFAFAFMVAAWIAAYPIINHLPEFA